MHVSQVRQCFPNRSSGTSDAPHILAKNKKRSVKGVFGAERKQNDSQEWFGKH